LAKYLPHEQRVRNSRTDGRRILFRVLRLEKYIYHCHDIVEVAIGDECHACCELSFVRGEKSSVGDVLTIVKISESDCLFVDTTWDTSFDSIAAVLVAASFKLSGAFVAIFVFDSQIAMP
jgi:hypothetical protein